MSKERRAGIAQDTQPGIDDFVDLVNSRITDIRNEIRKGHGTDFALVEESIDWVIRRLDLNWHTLSAVIAVERKTNPSYTPKTLVPLPRGLTRHYFQNELTKLNAVYRDLLEKIEKVSTRPSRGWIPEPLTT